MISVQTREFNDATPAMLSTLRYGKNWPVVYIIDDRKKEAYVGETLDASMRVVQHLQNPDRRRLTEINLISNDDFNKSVILDLEAFLIKHMSADGKFELQNCNMGLHDHNYFNRPYYESQFQRVWDRLLELDLADKDLHTIENSDLYKYSPFNSLSSDQYAAVSEIIRSLADAVVSNEKLTCVVHGGPGTGKTVLAVHMMKLLEERKYGVRMPDSEDEESVLSIAENLKRLPEDMKIGFVVPMQSLRTTLKNVFKQTAGLSADMVISPEELTKSTRHYGLLVVDEAHRLKRYKAIRDHKGFKEANKRMGLSETEGDELDWIRLRSDRQILFYDEYQSIKPADIPAEKFRTMFAGEKTKQFRLTTQFRCRGGDEYVQYVRNVFSETPPEQKQRFGEYDVRLFENCGDMVDAIRDKNHELGLCRTVAGFAWDWISRGKGNADKYDIELDDRKFRWNTTATDWVNSPSSVHEIGCIHTIQGYDLNYCGVIIGWEIDYDHEQGCFTVDKKKYHDTHGRETGKDIKLLESYIRNIYKTMLTRGICGTYIYACNPGLRKYLERYFDLRRHDVKTALSMQSSKPYGRAAADPYASVFESERSAQSVPRMQASILASSGAGRIHLHEDPSEAPGNIKTVSVRKESGSNGIRIGDRVSHAKWGKGTVRLLYAGSDDALVKFDDCERVVKVGEIALHED